jgi:hypothetical protein
MRRLIAALMLITVLGLVPPGTAQESEFQVPPELAKALVFIQVQRMYLGHALETGGTGVFIHPDGYIITDLHVVDEAFDAPGYEPGAIITAPVLEIQATFRDDQQAVRQLRAELVAVDSRHSLALLRVLTRHEAVVDVFALDQVPDVDRVVFVGFPYAGYLEEGGKSSSKDPRLTTIAANLSKITRAANQEITGFETRRLLDAGHCGGLALSPTGEVVGLAICTVDREARYGHGAAMTWWSGFFIARMVSYDLDPGVVLDPPLPIVATLESSIATDRFADWTAHIELTVEGTRVGMVPLETAENGWAGTIDVTQLGLAPNVRRIVVRALLIDSQRRPRFSRRINVDVVPGALAATQ